MAIPAGAYRANILGTLPMGEVFAWGWWVVRGGDPGASAAVQAADILADSDFRALITQARALASPQTAYVSLSVQRYGAGGRVDDVAQVGLGSVAGPGSGTTFHPSYTAFCVTLRDGHAGASHRNRFYIPVTGFTLTSSGLMALADAQGVVDVAAAYMVGGTAHVLSPKLGSSDVVTSVTADTKLDTQRGRNNHTAMARVSSTG